MHDCDWGIFVSTTENGGFLSTVTVMIPAHVFHGLSFVRLFVPMVGKYSANPMWKVFNPHLNNKMKTTATRLTD